MASGCFDSLAATYDQVWTNSIAGRLQRDAVWRYMQPLFQPGDHVLDLGCGTGEDAEHLARLGIRVSAIDASPEMVRLARSRGIHADVRNIEDVAALDGTFAGIISNFGALNCVRDLGSLRDSLAKLIPAKGHLAFCLMGRFCLMEFLHFTSQLRFRKAARRWRGQTFAPALGLHVYYPRASQIRTALSPHFQLVLRAGIGISVPPSYLSTVSPSSLSVRGKIDEHIARWPLLRGVADHQLFIFERTTCKLS